MLPHTSMPTDDEKYARQLHKVDSFVRMELAKIIRQEAELPLGTLVSIPRVATSVDVAHAAVYISVLPETAAQEVLEELERNVYHIQQRLNRRMVRKIVPKIRFVLDSTQVHADHIEGIIREEHADDANGTDATEKGA